MTDTAESPTRRITDPPRVVQLLAVLPQLALYGLFGLVLVLAWFVLVLGGLLFSFVGVGLVLLAALGFVLYAFAWLEERRVAWTFAVDVPAHPLKRSTRDDGWRVLDTVLRQWADGRSWLALLHGAIVSVLGIVTIAVLMGIGMAIGWLTAPLRGADFWVGMLGRHIASPLAALIGLVAGGILVGALFSLAAAHRALSMQLLVPNLEPVLRAEAEVQGQRRTQAMHAAEIERTRIERDLHDGVQPRLVSVAMTLGMAKRKLRDDPDGAERLIDEAHGSVKTAVTELRQLVRGIHPAVLQDRGLDAAFSALIGRSAIPVEISVDLHRRYSNQIEAAVYFAVAEALTNAAKHSGASAIRVLITEADGRVWARIDDDGRGGASCRPGGGLDGVQNRITAAGGTFSLSSPEGGPTTIEVSVPCAS